MTPLVLAGCASVIPDRVVDRGLVIENVTLISPERPVPLRDANIVIRDGRIAEIGTHLRAGRGAERIDGRGRYLVPGLIDSHVHVGHLAGLDEGSEAQPELAGAYRAQIPRAYLAFGFTLLVDLDLRAQDREWFEAAPLHPGLMGCGRALRVAGGYGALRVPRTAVTADFPYLVHEPAQAEAWPSTLDPVDHSPARAIARAVDDGAQCIKAFVEPGFGGVFNWPVPSRESLREIRLETRRRGLPLFVHATGVEAWRAALEAQADVIAHGLWHWPGDRYASTPPPETRRLIEAAAHARTGVQPTLQVVHGERAILDWSVLEDPRLRYALPIPVLAYMRSETAQAARRALAASYREAAGSNDLALLLPVAGERATQSLRLMNSAGVRLLFGSDTPGGEGIGNIPGLNGRLELQRWADGGLSPRQILRAATLDNAAMLGLANELGSLEVGKRADMLLLGADPLDSIEAFDSIEIIFLNGIPIARTSLLSPE